MIKFQIILYVFPKQENDQFRKGGRDICLCWRSFRQGKPVFSQPYCIVICVVDPDPVDGLLDPDRNSYYFLKIQQNFWKSSILYNIK
jgi:hypothetical protein